MLAADPHVAGRAEELRRSFDRSFAEAPRSDAVAKCELLAIHLRGEPHAIRLSEIGGLHVDKTITELPSPIPELRGIAGFRGNPLPVYDLGALLGYPAAKAMRWTIIVADASVALALDSFDGYLRVSTGAIASADGTRARDHIAEVVRIQDDIRPIVHLPSVIAALRARVPEAAPSEEQ